MSGGHMNSGAKLALFAAAGLIVGASAPAKAADLGGNCCADLEERIAELEATTARKGNRKVSLTVSGWVNEAVFFWDDGVESNAYVGTNGLEQSRFGFTGDAKIDGDWSAGYRLEIGVNGADSKTFSQDFSGFAPNSASPLNNLTVRQSHWYLKSKTYGKLSVGLAGTATYHLLDDTDITQTRNVSDAEAGPVGFAQFKIRDNGSYVNSLQWRDIAQGVNNDTPGQNGRRNIVRYDSPELAGFMITASWGEDDMGGVSLKYKGDLHDFKLAGSVGYEHNNDSTISACNTSNKDLDCEWWGAAATIMHAPTGLYVYAAYGEQQDDSEKDINPAADDTDTMWYVQAGIERKWHELGKTTIFGEYRHDDTGSNLGKNTGGTSATFIQDGNIDYFAAGVVQGIDAAAMQMYVVYRHYEGDFNNAVGTNFNLDSFDMVITGAKINF